MQRRLLVEAEIERILACTPTFFSLLPLKLSPETHDISDFSTFEGNITASSLIR
jgi:hypothetical protein